MPSPVGHCSAGASSSSGLLRALAFGGFFFDPLGDDPPALTFVFGDGAPLSFLLPFAEAGRALDFALNGDAGRLTFSFAPPTSWGAGEVAVRAMGSVSVAMRSHCPSEPMFGLRQLTTVLLCGQIAS